MNILTVNLLFSTSVFWIAAKIYLLPRLHECPVPQIRNNFSGRISQSFWPSFVKYTAAGVRYPRLMCSLS